MTEQTLSTASDIPAASWIDRWMPAPLRPYLRLARADRPIGTWLLLIPCWWGLAMAAPGWPDGGLMALFAVGALVMRGAGCTVNDLADREFDARVARTATRPIASGEVSVFRGVLFLALQLGIGFAILVQFNAFAIQMGVASLALVAVYPFMKRITYWPQLFLGLTFNWGALMGWAVINAGLGWPALWLYLAGIFWTLGYDTIYAHQDKDDDLQIGVKSSALKLGRRTKPWLVVFYALTLGLLGTAGYAAALGWPYYLALGVAAIHFLWQISRLDIDLPRDCLAKFKSNRDVGLIILAGIVAARAAAGGG
ncbi:MAG: 4-hydroxybenzoate octaprenyltransferase [Magnetovibrio sp.]|nr:4-hydroxybenzoate octaprenyltransferase [Magnetovibrio sp.]